MSQSDEIKANLDRADISLQSAQLLLEASFCNDAASRAYYSTFHSSTALLLSKGLTFGSHAGTSRAISLHFVKPGTLEQRLGSALNWLAQLRNVGDYGQLRQVTEGETIRAIEIATEFLAKTRILLSE
ncbi:MAG: HEPN domain-containing protein [Cyanobacteria bacterium J06634_5]